MERGLSESELETYEALYKYQGARIMFNCDEVTYEGIIDIILPGIRQVKLRHTKIVEGNNYLGNLRFRFREISSFKVVESAESVNRYPKNEYLLNILKNHKPVPSSTIAKVLYGDKLSDDDETDDEKTNEKIKEEKFVLDLPKHLQTRLPNDYTIIDKINEMFFQAVHFIAKQQVIGVSFHGPAISRFDKLTWLCVSTENCSFLFDIYYLGNEAFDKGLKQVFESKSIKKVIHDCRFLSDCLAHQYSTLLSNVFDTRVADFVIHMQHYSDKHKFRSWRSLDSCLRIYLKVPQEFLFEREECSKQKSFFSKRPISNGYLYDLLKSVLYLKLLHEKLFKKLLTPLYRATGFYKTVIAKSDSQLIKDLGPLLSRPDSIPPCLIMNGIETVRFQKPKDLSHFTLKFIHPITGKVVGPEITFGSKTAGNDSLFPKYEKNEISSFDKKPSKNKFYDVAIQEETPLFSNTVVKTSCNPVKFAVEEVEGDSLLPKPNFKQMDEIYHELVNRMSHSENKDKKSSENDHQLSKNSDESNDIWLKLRSEFIMEKAASYPYNRKIKFVPG